MDMQPDYDKPVAYTPDGQPLYARPAVGPNQPPADISLPPLTPGAYTAEPTQNQPAPTQQQATTVVHMTRSMEPLKQDVPPVVRQRHSESVKKYPQLDLSEHEYVVLSVRRHIFGLLPAIMIDIFLILLIIAVIVLYPMIVDKFSLAHIPGYMTVILFGVLGCAVLLAVLYLIQWVYFSNLFFLTNESIIERTQLTPFSSNVKSVGLGDVVDVSYQQTGIVQHIFGFGTVKIGTKDDTVPYIFNYVDGPKKQASILKDAVEAFKNGRALNEDFS